MILFFVFINLFLANYLANDVNNEFYPGQNESYFAYNDIGFEDFGVLPDLDALASSILDTLNEEDLEFIREFGRIVEHDSGEL